MRLIFGILLSSLPAFPFHSEIKNDIDREYIPRASVTQVGTDSLPSFRIINNASLRSLPGIVRDLSKAINEPGFRETFCLGKDGIIIFLQDLTCKSCDISASVEGTFSTSTYHVSINEFNRFARDKALAATLIHEVMHCVLLSIYRRALHLDKTALESIKGFGLDKRDSSGFGNDFFLLMNDGEEGSHELMHRLFFTQMVLLLKRFAEIHRRTLGHDEAEVLMWSGLQNTAAYQKLNENKRSDIEFSILEAKGLTHRMR